MTGVNPPDYVLRCAQAKDFAPLVWRLRNGIELTAAERNFLADYLEGKRGGRGRGSSPSKAWRARFHFRLFFWLTEYEGRQPDHAYDEVAQIHNISRNTAIEYVKLAEATGHAEQVRSQEQALSEIESEGEHFAVVRAEHRRLVLEGKRLFQDGGRSKETGDSLD